MTRHDDAMTLGTFGSVMIETRPIVSGENGGLGLDAVARRRRP